MYLEGMKLREEHAQGLNETDKQKNTKKKLARMNRDNLQSYVSTAELFCES